MVQYHLVYVEFFSFHGVDITIKYRWELLDKVFSNGITTSWLVLYIATLL